MLIQGWTPINSIIASTDQHGIHAYDIIQLPIVSPERPSPARDKLGHDLLEEIKREKARGRLPAQTPPTSTGASKKARSNTLQAKYQDYPPDTPDQEIIDGDPDLIQHGNLFRLAKKYTMLELVNAINANHSESVATQPQLSNRLKRAIDRIAKGGGKERNEVLVELRLAQKENGVTINGRRVKKPVEEDADKGRKRKKSDDDDGDQKAVKKRKSRVQVDLGADKENVAEHVVENPDREILSSGFIKLIT